MSKQFIKLNDNDEHLSLGNLFRIIKESSKNKTSALQSELFCLLFDLDFVNDTTVNNYCVGCRSIGGDYKQIFINKNNRFQKNEEEFCDSILGIINVIDGEVHTGIEDKIVFIDNSSSALELARKLYNLAKNDRQVKVDFTNLLYRYLEEKKIYKCLVEEIVYVVLTKKQPLYEEELKREVFENVLNDTSISSISLQEYLSLKLREGINYDYSMRKLADAGNAYANFEIGSDEYYGHVTGKPRYTEALKYLKRAAEEKHAAANYMTGSIYVRGLVGNKSKEELEKGYQYLMKARELGNIAASNLIGTMYNEGIYPLEKNLNKAIEFFKSAAEANYVFAINNLGRIEENASHVKEAYELYLKSADLGESWACNKIGEAYRTGILLEDGMKAYGYYNKALECNYRTLCYYAYHNLAKYYYMNGYDSIEADLNKAIEYFKIAAENNILDSAIELFYIYAKDYKKKQDQESYNQIMHYKKMIESHSKFNKDIKTEIEKKLSEIRNKQEISIKSIEDLIR